MSRSRKKNPFVGITTARSEKDDKRKVSRRVRRRVRQIPLGERTDRLDSRLHDGAWMFSKDGRMRFDPAARPEHLRK